MKVIVCGNLIETDLIYKIGQVRPNLHVYIEFVIYFLNNNKEEIRVWVGNDKKGNEFKEHVAYIYAELNRIRDELVKFWLLDQTDIPVIYFKTDKKY